MKYFALSSSSDAAASNRFLLWPWPILQDLPITRDTGSSKGPICEQFDKLCAWTMLLSG
jgi:hypothetical protein